MCQPCSKLATGTTGRKQARFAPTLACPIPIAKDKNVDLKPSSLPLPLWHSAAEPTALHGKATKRCASRYYRQQRRQFIQRTLENAETTVDGTVLISSKQTASAEKGDPETPRGELSEKHDQHRVVLRSNLLLLRSNRGFITVLGGGGGWHDSVVRTSRYLLCCQPTQKSTLFVRCSTAIPPPRASSPPSTARCTCCVFDRYMEGHDRIKRSEGGSAILWKI